MTKTQAARARKSAWSPEARKKRELTIARKRAAREGQEVGNEQASELIASMMPPTKAADAERKTRKARPTTSKRESMAIQLLEMALSILRGET